MKNPKITVAVVVLLGVVLVGASSCANRGDDDADVVGISQPLTNKTGDATRGEKIAINRKLGNCLACHAVPELSSQPFHGEVGPSLSGVSDRYNEAQLRQILVDVREIFPDTIMPAFHSTTGLNRVAKKFQGKTILTAQEVEDVVAYLQTLK